LLETVMTKALLWTTALTLGLCVLFATLAARAPVVGKPGPFDWPQWQGPERTAVSHETKLLQTWPKGGPKLAWEVKGLGEGYSTPTVAAGRIFSMGNRRNTEYLMALDEKDGTELWATGLGRVRSNGGGYEGPRCSPTVDGDLVYALGLNGDLICVRAATGKEVWRRNLQDKDLAGSVGGWGYSESPLIDGDKVICTPGGKTATLAALNKKNGETIWKAVTVSPAVPEGDSAHYASSIAVTVDGRRQYIQFLSLGVVGLSGDGAVLWRYHAPHNGTANCSTPLFADNHVFAASGYGTGGGLVHLIKKGDKYKAEEVYFTKSMKNQHGGMVLLQDHIYGSDEEFLTCLDFKTGKKAWAERQGGKGSIAFADGRLYYRNEDGPILLVEATPEKYIEHGRFEQPRKSGHNTWPHPVIANGKLYIRDQDFLFCYDVKRR